MSSNPNLAEAAIAAQAPPATHAPPVAPAPRLEHVDGLRAFACLSVFFMHCWMMTDRPCVRIPILGRSPNPLRILMFGNTGVHLFLVLSGFCLFYTFARPNGLDRFHVGRFAIKRIRRIVPAYYAALVIGLVLPLAFARLNASLGTGFQVRAPTTVPSVLLHLVLFHGFSPFAYQDINGVFWSLSLEWQLYFAFPLLVWGFHRLGPSVIVVAAFAIDIAWRLFAFRTWGTSNVAVAWVATSNGIGRCTEFVLGMLAAWQLWRPSPAILPRLGSGLFVAGFCALAVAAGRTAPFTPFNDLLWGCAYYCLLKAVLQPGSIPHRVMSLAPMALLGEISYSVYLLHMPVLEILGNFVRFASNGLRLAALAPAAGLVTFVLAKLWFNWFERPYIGDPAPARRARSLAVK